MKTLPLVFFAACFLTPLHAANKASSVTSVKLKAASSSMGRTTDKKWSTSWGSYNKDIFRARAVKASLLSSGSGKVTVQCYWVVSPAGSRTQTVKAGKAQTVTLKSGSRKTVEFAELFMENDTKYNALGVQTHEGIKYKGWVIRVSNASGKTLAAQGSRPPLIGVVAKWLKGK